jgi:putative membrane protein
MYSSRSIFTVFIGEDGERTWNSHAKAPLEWRAPTQDDAMSKKLALLVTACLLWATLAPAQTRVATQDFVTKVAISDMMEIQSSELALARQPDADTKPFAEKMVKDHQRTSRELKALVDSGKVKASLPSALGAEHQKKLEDLKAKSGKDFDRSYDQIQVQAHEEAVALFEAYAASGDNLDLKSWAEMTLPHLKEHLAMAKKLS